MVDKSTRQYARSNMGVKIIGKDHLKCVVSVKIVRIHLILMNILIIFFLKLVILIIFNFILD